MRRSRSKINFNKNMNGKGWPLNSKPNKHSFTQSCLEMQENIFFPKFNSRSVSETKKNHSIKL